MTVCLRVEEWSDGDSISCVSCLSHSSSQSNQMRVVILIMTSWEVSIKRVHVNATQEESRTERLSHKSLHKKGYGSTTRRRRQSLAQCFWVNARKSRMFFAYILLETETLSESLWLSRCFDIPFPSVVFSRQKDMPSVTIIPFSSISRVYVRWCFMWSLNVWLPIAFLSLLFLAQCFFSFLVCFLTWLVSLDLGIWLLFLLSCPSFTSLLPSLMNTEKGSRMRDVK